MAYPNRRVFRGTPQKTCQPGKDRQTAQLLTETAGHNIVFNGDKLDLTLEFLDACFKNGDFVGIHAIVSVQLAQLPLFGFQLAG